MNYKNKYFTLVEVLLALGVCAIGVCSIMVLFPVGASASRDAAALTYVANMAEEFLHFKEYQITYSADNWTKFIAPGADQIQSRPVKLEYMKMANLEPTAKNLGDLPKVVHSRGDWKGGGSDEVAADLELQNFGSFIYRFSGNKDVFQIIAKRGVGADSWIDTDFRCIAVLYRSTIKYEGDVTLDEKYATRLNLEISWPAEIPYDQRQKRVFSLDIFNLQL